MLLAYSPASRAAFSNATELYHPALAGFPTKFHSDWQWEDIVNSSRGLVLDDLPGDLQPIVQVIDDWNTFRKLGLVFEGRVGGGRLLICAIDLDSDLDANRRPCLRPSTRPLR